MKKIFYLDINKSCNNNCLGCAIDPSTKDASFRSFDEIKDDLEEGKKQGYQIVHLIGGEITLHPNLTDILKKAKDLGYKVVLTSNGRMFSYDKYAKKFKGLVSSFSITLFGANKKTHESWTRSLGSYEQTIKGIQNLIASGFDVCLNIPIWVGNINELDIYLKIINDLKIKEVGVLMLGPFGRLKKEYLKYSPSLIDLYKLNDFLIKAKDIAEDIDVEDFPLCIFKDEALNAENIHFQDISSSVYIGDDGKIETIGLFAASEKGYPINSIKLNNGDVFKLKDDVNSFKSYSSICDKCGLKSKCNGLYNEFISNKVVDEIFALFKLTGRVSTLVLNTTYKCNFNCSYCPTVKKNESMSIEIAKKSVDLLLKKKMSFYEIKFFGGEPLLEFDLVKDIISYALSKSNNIKFMLTTNGSLLDEEKIKFFLDNDVDLRVSIDGTEKFQELNRGKDANNVVDKLKGFEEKVTINMVVSNNNCSGFFDNFSFLYNRGFRRFNFLPAFFTDWKNDSFEVLESEMEKIKEFLIGKDVQIRNKEVFQENYLFTNGWCVDCDGSIYLNNDFLLAKDLHKEDIINAKDIFDFGAVVKKNYPVIFNVDTEKDKINKKLDDLFNQFVEVI